ncbi:hypothetical protein M9458_049334, partial [Cirrhinus mrigala]
MNEREFVETALSLLKEDEQCAKDATQAPEEVRIIPKTDEEDMTYVSHIAELETVPYGNCMEEGTSTKPDCHLKPPTRGSGASEKPDVDDEALKL